MPADAITIHVDYRYDTSDFFGSGNPQGPAAGNQARATIEAVASDYSEILGDTFASLATPPAFQSSASNGVAEWRWTGEFRHPSTSLSRQFLNESGDTEVAIGTDEYVVFVGARNYAGGTLGTAGPGHVESASSQTSGNFSPGEQDQLEQISSDFFAALETRGQASGFATWGGSISFDTVPQQYPWHFDHTTPPPSGNGQPLNDFYSVAVHEMAHALGFGTFTDGSEIGRVATWQSLVSGDTFIGANAQSENGNQAVPLAGDGDRSHWAAVSSTVYGSTTQQRAAMEAGIAPGTRRRLTDLDAAALQDIGWELLPLPSLPGDYNGNGTVDAADYTVWRDSLGQSVLDGTGADGDENGIIDTSDYLVWKNHFGASQAAGSAAGRLVARVPEPSAGWLLLAGAGLWGLSGPRRE